MKFNDMNEPRSPLDERLWKKENLATLIKITQPFLSEQDFAGGI